MGDLAEFGVWLSAILIAIVIPSVSSFFTVEPNQAVVLACLIEDTDHLVSTTAMTRVGE